MFFVSEEYGDVLVEVVELNRATLNEADEFKQRLTEDINNGYKKIIADLSACEFIDSTFLGTLVISLKKVTSLGGDLRLVGFKPAVHSMFELTRMYRVFETFNTKKDAINSFK
ncbi:STAS domain-containing protein [bacterium BMS3Abin03]|jgi:anti-anti-sigma factor|nr:STAS domain-containing protein [bacterium BMS3Abin03]MCG6959943.1 STAS domain-containing protein [bacterium BMS3Abin03]